ncbi:cellulose binding domain-containing protein [Kitasatospora sp. NPDC008050]|uniref:cellulose binding domain-containing protein n=1 Tax=Kitasatospora sp. NPDC008050 TaxID=3364021 RepID=UPI0036E95773
MPVGPGFLAELLTLTNYGDTDVVNPTISFRVPNGVTVSPHSGEVTQDGTTVTAFLPNYQNTIAAGAVQELTVGCNLRGDGSTPPAWLPDTFTANGASIDSALGRPVPADAHHRLRRAGAALRLLRQLLGPVRAVHGDHHRTRRPRGLGRAPGRRRQLPRRPDPAVRHVAAIGRLLQDNPALKLSYPLPADGDPTGVLGLTGESVRLLQRLAAAGIQPALINGALLGFGQGAPADVFDAVKNAPNGMFTQFQAVWPDWDGAKVWRRIGACPMFGRTFSDKVFTLENMRRLAAFATERNIGCLSGWTANRDAEPGGQVRGTGVDQQPYDFTKIIATYRK